jgi:hypothetical protein
MSKQINVDEILAKQGRFRDLMTVEGAKAAVKEILEQYTELVKENATASVRSNGQWVSIGVDAYVYKPSIDNCLKLVKYE